MGQKGGRIKAGSRVKSREFERAMQEGGLYWKPGVQYGGGQPVKS